MSTLVVFHAHPDDEAIATGGTMAKAAAAGHRVVLVVATRGERGEVAEGYLEPGEELWQRRVEETHAAAAVLGASRVEFLGYVDSGMVGTARRTTTPPASGRPTWRRRPAAWPTSSRRRGPTSSPPTTRTACTATPTTSRSTGWACGRLSWRARPRCT